MKITKLDDPQRVNEALHIYSEEDKYKSTYIDLVSIWSCCQNVYYLQSNYYYVRRAVMTIYAISAYHH
jgi:hypothetical protein